MAKVIVGRIAQSVRTEQTFRPTLVAGEGRLKMISGNRNH